MNITSDQQYQTSRKEFLTLKNRGNLTAQDQTRFNDLQTAVDKWESSANFHGERVGTRSSGDIKGGIGDENTSSSPRS